MSFEEQEKRWENISQITKNLTKNQVKLLLTKFFEISETVEIVSINRKSRVIDGFLLLKKKVFSYRIEFFALTDRDELLLNLQSGSMKTDAIKEISIEKESSEIEVYLKQENEYLFSIFL
jgi:hypothetical protein